MTMVFAVEEAHNFEVDYERLEAELDRLAAKARDLYRAARQRAGKGRLAEADKAALYKLYGEKQRARNHVRWLLAKIGSQWLARRQKQSY
jgi:hypothetical protein